MEYSATELPALIIFYRNKPLLYKGAHAANPLVAYLKKIENANAVVKLDSKESVVDFIGRRVQDDYSLSTAIVVHTCVYVWLCIYMYVYMHICIYVCVNICVCSLVDIFW